MFLSQEKVQVILEERHMKQEHIIVRCHQVNIIGCSVLLRTVAFPPMLCQSSDLHIGRMIFTIAVRHYLLPQH